MQRKAEGSKAFVQDNYAAAKWDDPISCIDDGGALVVTAMDRLDDPSKAIGVPTFANFGPNLFCGITQIVVERDMQKAMLPQFRFSQLLRCWISIHICVLFP
ncbi:hypothetical protein MHU86_3960 [Fragilaria crotonensis]|nr:hypothetical protein MHU86_3960 [Fragilaria crotonensis]